jgi:mycothiol synthase
VVHPKYRRRGLGGALLVEAIARAEAQGARRLDLWGYNASDASVRAAARLGFRPERRLLHLHRHMRSLPTAQLPAGARVRAFEPGRDEAAWLELNARAFAGHPEQGRWTMEDLGIRMAQPWFRPEDLLLLEMDGALAGSCWLKIQERATDGRVGEIYVIATAPECQGRGIGRGLLAHALGYLRERSADVAAIYVDQANTSAVHLYETTGFHYHHVDVCFSRDLPVELGLTRAAHAAA